MKINFPPAYTVVFRILWMQFLVIYKQLRKYFLFMLKQWNRLRVIKIIDYKHVNIAAYLYICI